MRRAVAGFALVATLVSCGAPSGALSPGASTTSATTASPRVVLPSPIPQAITRTSAAAQVAWIGVAPQGGKASLVGVDPSGKIVGRLERDLGSFFRSTDGAQLFVVSDQVRSYSALDGSLLRNYGPTPGGAPLDAAFSPDGRWLALLGSRAYAEVIDLASGATQTTPLGHDPNALHPGLSCPSCDPSALTWSTLVFSPDSRHVYTIVDWGGPLRLTAFDVTPKGLTQTGTAVDGQGGQKFPSCAAAIAARVVNGGRTLAVFCHLDGRILFFDLATLTSAGVVQAEMRNPFWIAPIFTPDGQLLYLHQYPAFGDQVQVVDLRTQKLLGPVRTPLKLSDPGPFAWLFTVAYAGGTPSTVPVSPDGLRLYVAGTGDGVTVLQVPDLKPVAKLAPGTDVGEVWISGDGRTVYGMEQGKGLVITASDGSVKRVDVHDAAWFLASEHG